MSLGRGRALTLLVLALTVGGAKYGNAAQTCLPCNPLGRDSVEDCCDEPCLGDAEDNFPLCACASFTRLDACLGRCEPVPGHCAVSQECVAECDAQAGAYRQRCVQEARKTIGSRESSDPAGCGGDRRCKIGLRETGRIVRACFLEGTSINRTRSFCVDSGLLAPRAAPSCDDTDEECDDAADSHGCQKACVASVVRDCYHDCDDACEGNRRALKICQLGCRNKLCDDIKRRCTCHGDGDDNETCSPRGVSQGYAACCLSDAGCRTALGPDIQCVVTTTSPTTTRTTSSSTSTTTTRVTTVTTSTLI